jgi:hypothetical protein
MIVIDKTKPMLQVRGIAISNVRVVIRPVDECPKNGPRTEDQVKEFGNEAMVDEKKWEMKKNKNGLPVLRWFFSH